MLIIPDYKTRLNAFSQSLSEALVNKLYRVQIDGEESTVLTCNVSAYPFNRPWPGKQRDFSQTEKAGYMTFCSDKAVKVRVECANSFSKAVLRPLSKSIELQISGNTIEFTLSEKGQYVLETDSEHNALHIFFDSIKEYPDKEKATYCFGPGVHFPGIISLKDNESVYIDREALVYGGINSVGAKNIKVYGGGIIDNSCEERISERCYENYAKGTFRIYNCENVSVEDVILLNSCNWVLAVFDSNTVNIDSIKIVGQWRYNTDGIDITNTSNVTIKNSFIRSFDDTIVLKAINNFKKPVENIFVENCVCWCGWGRTLEIGLETYAKEYRNISFKNCDVIHSYFALDIQNGHHAVVHGVKYENIHVELQNDTQPMILQENDSQVYSPGNQRAMYHLIHINNSPMRLFYAFETEILPLGQVYDVEYKNIFVYTEDGVPKPTLLSKSYDTSVHFEKFFIDGLYLNGEKQNDLSNFEIFAENSDGFALKKD